MSPKFFITHSWKDIEFARRLTDDLHAHGLDGFFDAYSIQPGDDIASRVARGLEACDVYVPLLSPAAVASAWCELEINAAINLSLERKRLDREGKERPRIIPVDIAPCELPTLLKGRLHINFASGYADALDEFLSKGLGISPPLPRVKFRKGGKKMVLIPAGEFFFGVGNSNKGDTGYLYHVDDFYMDCFPVSNSDYKKFIDATKYRSPSYWVGNDFPIGREGHPVVLVSWDNAIEYAKWAGGRLPTEAEWEKAARGSDKRLFPWGNQFDTNRCNVWESGFRDTTPIGKFPLGSSPYDLGDMSGNVLEWCMDQSDEDNSNPLGEKSRDVSLNEKRVLKGGAWCFHQNEARISSRRVLNPQRWYKYIGFRLVIEAEKT